MALLRRPGWERRFLDDGEDAVLARIAAGENVITISFLMEAFMRDYARVVTELINRGVNLDTRTELGVSLGQTLLYELSERGSITIIEALLGRGISPNFTVNIGMAGSEPSLETPIYRACRAQSSDIIKRILEHTDTTHINIQNVLGLTPLIEAISRSAVRDIPELLIVKGADVNAKSVTGMTPLGVAQMKGDAAIIDLLRRSGATNIGSAGAPHIPSQLARASSHTGAVSNSLPIEILLGSANCLYLRGASYVEFVNTLVTDMGLGDRVLVHQGIHGTIHPDYELVSLCCISFSHAFAFTLINGRWNLLENQLGIRVELLTSPADFLEKTSEEIVFNELRDKRIWIYCRKPTLSAPYESLTIARQYGTTCAADTVQNAVFFADGLRDICLARMPAILSGAAVSPLTKKVVERMNKTMSQAYSLPIFTITSYYSLFADLAKIDPRSAEAALFSYYLLVPSTSDADLASLLNWSPEYIVTTRETAAKEAAARPTPPGSPAEKARWIWDNRATFEIVAPPKGGRRTRRQKYRKRKQSRRR